MFNKNRDMDMVSGPLFKNVLFYAFPLMLSGIMQLAYNAVAVIVVGRYSGQQSLAAVGSTGSLNSLIINMFMSLSVGVTVTVAQGIGAKNKKLVSDTVHTAILIGLVCGVIVATAGFFISYPALSLMGTPYDVIDKAALYMKIYFLGTPASIIYNFGAGILMASGDTKRPLYFLSISGAVNVALNLLLVIGFKWDVAGVAFANIVAQYISAFFIISALTKSKTLIHLDLKKMRINMESLKRIIRIGIPACIQSTAFAISNVMIQSAVNSFGDSAIVAGNAAAANLDGFIYTSTNAFYHAAVSFTGQNVGAKKYDRIWKILRSCMIWVVIVGVSLGMLLVLFRRQLLGIYAPGNEAVIQYGFIRIMLVAPLYFLCGEMEVASGSLRGMGCSVTPMVVSILGACGLRILWIFTIFRTYHTLQMLYISLPISWIITTSVHMICWVFVKRNLVRRSET